MSSVLIASGRPSVKLTTRSMAKTDQKHRLLISCSLKADDVSESPFLIEYADSWWRPSSYDILTAIPTKCHMLADVS